MKVSTRGDYAARALLSLALHGSDRPTSVKEIAERTGLPQPYLEQILLAVKGAGPRALEAGGGRRLRARPSARRDHPGRHPRRGRRSRSPRCSASTTTARVTASCRRCGSACPTRPADPRALHAAGAGRTHAHRPPRRRLHQRRLHQRRLDQRRLAGRERRSGGGDGRELTLAVAPVLARGRGHVAASHPHDHLEPAGDRRLERDVTAVADDQLAHDGEPEAEVAVRTPVLAGAARLPEAVEGTRRARRRSCPAPRR